MLPLPRLRAPRPTTPACGPKRAAATVTEFAFIAPVIFVFLLGLIELTRGLMVVHLLNNAARDGCRVGILEGKASSDITTAVNSTLSALGIRSDTVTVQVNDGSADASSAQPGDEITVIVSVPIGSVSWLPVVKYFQGNLKGQYTLRRE